MRIPPLALTESSTDGYCSLYCWSPKTGLKKQSVETKNADMLLKNAPAYAAQFCADAKVDPDTAAWAVVDSDRKLVRMSKLKGKFDPESGTLSKMAMNLTDALRRERVILERVTESNQMVHPTSAGLILDDLEAEFYDGEGSTVHTADLSKMAKDIGWKGTVDSDAGPDEGGRSEDGRRERLRASKKIAALDFDPKNTGETKQATELFVELVKEWAKKKKGWKIGHVEVV